MLDQKWPHLRTGFNRDDPKDRRIAEGWIIVALAGEFADAFQSGRIAGSSSEAMWDFRVAEALAERLFENAGHRSAFLNQMRCRTHYFVSDPMRWSQITAVALRLSQLRVLDRQQVEQIMNEIAADRQLRGIDKASPSSESQGGSPNEASPL